MRRPSAERPRDAELVELLAQHLGVDHDAVAEHAELAGEEDAARQETELERLVADLDGVAGVVAALVARDDGERLCEQIDDLALALVAPLGADDDGAVAVAVLTAAG